MDTIDPPSTAAHQAQIGPPTAEPNGLVSDVAPLSHDLAPPSHPPGGHFVGTDLPLAGPHRIPARDGATADAPSGNDDPFGREPRSLRKRLGGVLAAIGALAVKFGAYIKAGILLLPKLKLLTTAATALVSVVAYSLFWGWWFAVGFVVLIFVHEMGHVIQLRREGVKASSPMFVPFLGAVISARSLGRNALAEARVGLAGPVLGSIGAGGCLLIAQATDSSFFKALAYVGFLINLFNLIPVLPLDGGRAMAAMAPWMWFVGFALLIPIALFVHAGFVLFVVIIFGGREVWHRWQQRKTRSIEQAAYYRVAPRHRLIVGAVYLGLIVALVLGMADTHVLSVPGHSFRSI